MQVSDVQLVAVGDEIELEARVTTAFLPEPFRLWYRFPAIVGESVDAGSGDFLVAALLLPAMKTGERVELPMPISPQLRNSLKWTQTVYQAWDPTLSRADFHAPPGPLISPVSSRVGLFFSCGVDSFYSLIRNTVDHPLNEDVVDTLIVINGADIYLSDGKQQVFKALLDRARRSARHYGKQVIPVVTNAKELLSAYSIRRGFIGHGTTLFTVGLALERLFSKIRIPSANSYDDLAICGTHPLLDPLWSTENLQFINDGMEARRLEKTQFLARHDVALENLRVCWAKESGLYNCGRCSKCLRTMLGLYVSGALDRSRTLPNTIDPELLSRLPVLAGYEADRYFEPLLSALGPSPADVRLRVALAEGIGKAQRYFARVAEAKQQIDRTIPFDDSFILVDGDGMRQELGIGRRVVPFLEKEGPPVNEEVAIQELEKLKNAGARFMVFWWSDFWWLNHYQGLNRHLRSKYRCGLDNEALIIFDLRAKAEVKT